jgi:hypothetical protein
MRSERWLEEDAMFGCASVAGVRPAGQLLLKNTSFLLNTAVLQARVPRARLKTRASTAAGAQRDHRREHYRGLALRRACGLGRSVASGSSGHARENRLRKTLWCELLVMSSKLEDRVAGDLPVARTTQAGLLCHALRTVRLAIEPAPRALRVVTIYRTGQLSASVPRGSKMRPNCHPGVVLSPP